MVRVRPKLDPNESDEHIHIFSHVSRQQLSSFSHIYRQSLWLMTKEGVPLSSCVPLVICGQSPSVSDDLTAARALTIDLAVTKLISLVAISPSVQVAPRLLLLLLSISLVSCQRSRVM